MGDAQDDGRKQNQALGGRVEANGWLGLENIQKAPESSAFVQKRGTITLQMGAHQTVPLKVKSRCYAMGLEALHHQPHPLLSSPNQVSLPFTHHIQGMRPFSSSNTAQLLLSACICQFEVTSWEDIPDL